MCLGVGTAWEWAGGLGMKVVARGMQEWTQLLQPGSNSRSASKLSP